MNYVGKANSPYGIVKKFLEDREIPYDGYVDGKCHYKFAIRHNDDLKIVSVSLHKGNPRSVIYALQKIRQFFRKHGVYIQR